MIDLVPAINEIVKYGLEPNISEDNCEEILEKNLVTIYRLYFEISYEFDSKDYVDFDKAEFPEIRKTIESNFTDFGYYNKIIDISDLENPNPNAIGDAIDDLTDIILDLLEVKWRIERNSMADGLWFFELIFRSHTQQHILDLLNYMKLRDG